MDRSRDHPRRASRVGDALDGLVPPERKVEFSRKVSIRASLARAAVEDTTVDLEIPAETTSGRYWP